MKFWVKDIQLLKKDGKARRGRFETPHGTIETPVFMNVGTLAAIKGGVSSMDLKEIGCQVELSNTYHSTFKTKWQGSCKNGWIN